VVLKSFKNFLMQGDIIVIAIGLVVATAFSTLIHSFTSNVINPLVSRAEGKDKIGLGVQLGAKGNNPTFLNFGMLISDVIYFVIYMAVIYFVLVLPYKHIQAGRGVTVFGSPSPAKSCPACLSGDLPVAATKCRYCGTEMLAA
jgi:large conductance mechanosensitive channel